MFSNRDIYVFVFYFIYLWLCWVFVAVRAFLWLWEQGLLSHCHAWASHCGGFSYGEAQAPGEGLR